ncbi:hypothetical protein L1987_46313 [Smallanthus sonchifolius]|uniref:Uncharacterized protein n=1 Tax=Smallanthus sonchifolius TaxID=185202 RepID=A0ACB9FZE1_9ASTR|nr:hypothetical protein L1987_46313 [Smallanthus sonchifolius]
MKVYYANKPSVAPATALAAPGFPGRNKDTKFNLRKGRPKEWKSSTTLYGYPVNPGSLQNQIVNALHLGERGRASTLLSHIGHGKHILKANHFVQILAYCAMKPDPLFVMEIWRITEEKEIDMNNKCHVFMIEALCKGGYIEELVLALEDFDEALILLNQACSEGIQLDALLFNTIINVASWKGRIDIIEYVMDNMHTERVPPDSTTCGHVLTAYVNQGFYNTAMEALQVMSVHMLSEEDEDNKTVFKDLIYAEDSEAESRALDLFKDSEEDLSVALFNLRWCAMMGNLISLSTIRASGSSGWLSATNSFRSSFKTVESILKGQSL